MIRAYHKIKQYIRNLRIFHNTLTNFQPWDSYGLLLAMKDSSIGLHNYISEVDDFVSVNRDKDCKRIKIFINSLDRMIKDEYCTITDFEYVSNKERDGVFSIECVKIKDYPSQKIKYRVEESQKEVDREIVAKAFLKYYDKWWH